MDHQQNYWCLPWTKCDENDCVLKKSRTKVEKLQLEGDQPAADHETCGWGFSSMIYDTAVCPISSQFDSANKHLMNQVFDQPLPVNPANDPMLNFEMSNQITCDAVTFKNATQSEVMINNDSVVPIFNIDECKIF